MRRVVSCLAVTVSLALCFVSIASAATFNIRSKWMDCSTTKSGLSFRTEFNYPARAYGTGRYLIKSQIRWDRHTSAGWRNWDRNTIQTEWTEITNPDFNFGLSHGDRTNWGESWFAGRWRAHVIVKLIKNRAGPKDKQVEKVERFFEKPQFHARNCGLSFAS